jgi:hypothetical protein
MSNFSSVASLITASSHSFSTYCSQQSASVIACSASGTLSYNPGQADCVAASDILGSPLGPGATCIGLEIICGSATCQMFSSGSGSSTGSSPSIPATYANSSSPGHSNHETNLRSGQIAGIAVGTFLVVLLLVGALFFLLLRRSRRNRQANSHVAHVPSVTGPAYGEKGYVLATATAADGGADANLPQPVEDNKIVSEMSNLRDKIKNHTQNYYHTEPIDPSRLNDSALQGTSRVVSIPVPQLRDLLLNPATRIAAIRACIAGVIFGRFGGPSGVVKDSLLPAEVASSADALENLGNPGKPI